MLQELLKKVFPSWYSKPEQSEDDRLLTNRLAELNQPDALPKRNQINAIKPYMWEGLWVFDDPSVGLDKEALVAGMPEMILHACTAVGIQNPEKGFLALFSKDPFPGAKICLQWVREDMGGNVYMYKEANIEGWLCPALFKYFDEAPQQMYIDLRPIA